MRLSIATRIFLGFAAVVTVFGAASSFAIWRMHAIGADIRLVSEGYLPLTKVSAQLETIHKNKQRDTDRLVDEKDPRAQRILIKLARLYFPRIIREKLGQGEELLAEARRLSGPEEQPFLDGLEGRLRELLAEYDQYDVSSEALFVAMEAGAGEVEERGKELRRLERRIDRQIKLLSIALEGRIQERVQEAQARERSSSWAIIGFSLGAIFLGICAAILSVRLLAPVRVLTEAAVRIGRGDYSAEVPTEAADEVGVLAREFNQMAASLRAREKELREKQEALLRAEKLATVGKMAAQIAHEIRNPLSSIGLNTELLAEAFEEGDEEARRLCAAIGKEVDRLADVTDQYLRYARLAEPELAQEDLATLVKDLAAFVGPELDQAGIRLELELPERLATTVDERQMRQAMLNLIRNAREAMGPGGLLRIRGEGLPDGQVRLDFQDSGAGMEAEQVARIFEPFFTTKRGGTGLGLSLTQQIISQHGGSLHCESAPSQGTRFTITLPGAAARGEPAPGAGPLALRPAL